MPILTRAETHESQYGAEQVLMVNFTAGDMATTTLIPLLAAVERDYIVDHVELRCVDFGTSGATVTLKRAPDGTALNSGTAMSAATAIHGTTDNNFMEISLYESKDDVTNPRLVLSATKDVFCLQFSNVTGTPNDALVYVRYRSKRE
jgi:hypothetical protein